MSLNKTNIIVLFSFVLVITSLVVFSDDIAGNSNGFEQDGFRYEIIPGTDEVKIYGTETTPSDFEIQPYVEHGGKTYKVTTVGASAFYDFDPKDDFVFPDTVTVLEENSFSSCNFVSVDLKNVSKLGSSCFYQVSATKIIIRESVDQIYEDSFVLSKIAEIVVENNPNFILGEHGVLMSADGKTVYKAPYFEDDDYAIPEGVEIVCPYAFGGSINGDDPILKLTGTLFIPDSVREIRCGAFCFTEFSSLNYSKENSCLKSIGNGAFLNCSNLKFDFIAPDSLEIIDAMAFNGTALTSINTNNVRILGDSVFSIPSSTEPTELLLGDKLEVIDYCAFQCREISNVISIPKNVYFIGHNAFNCCHNTETSGSLTIQFEGDIPLMGFDCFNVSPDYGNEVEIIAPCAEGKIGYIFDDYVMGVTHVTNSDDYICIKEKYLSDGFCFNLYSNHTAKLVRNDEQTNPIINPVIPQSVIYENEEYAVTKIGNDVFISDMVRGTLTLPEGLECIQRNAFCDCINLNGKLTIPSTVEYLGFNCFQSTGFTELDIKTEGNNGLRFIDFGAIANSPMVNVSLPDTVVALGDGIFCLNETLKSVDIGNGVRYLGVGCFNQCVLKNVVFGNSLEIISKGCFSKSDICCNLVFPESLLYIGNDAFSNVGDMNGKTVVFRGDMPYSDHTFHLSTTEATRINLETNGWANQKTIEHMFGSMVEVNYNERGGNVEYLNYIIPILVALSLITALGIALYRKK